MRQSKVSILLVLSLKYRAVADRHVTVLHLDVRSNAALSDVAEVSEDAIVGVSKEGG